jgi:cobalt/nickel transport system permease protein
VHIPDGFIDAPVSVAAGAVAVAGVAVCLRGARNELDERTAPMAGLTAAFIFAVQALNFPVASGTSGHLLGGALAAILVGPYTGALCVTVALLVQGLVFADGGVSALGLNIVNMAFVTTVVGWAVFRAVRGTGPPTKGTVVVGAFLAALLSVPAASLAFVLEFAQGGTADVSLGAVTVAMVGVHILIGIGEALITGFIVASVLAVRPDLVYGARHLVPRLELHSSPTGRRVAS